MQGNMQNQSQKEKNRLQVVETGEGEDDPTCKTFVMLNEDHTLGNALRYILMKNPQVQFCGYTVPHPLENKIHFRLQTYGDVSAQEVLRKGLVDLKEVCAHIKSTFEAAAAEPNLGERLSPTPSDDPSN